MHACLLHPLNNCFYAVSASEELRFVSASELIPAVQKTLLEVRLGPTSAAFGASPQIETLI